LNVQLLTLPTGQPMVSEPLPVHIAHRPEILMYAASTPAAGEPLRPLSPA